MTRLRVLNRLIIDTIAETIERPWFFWALFLFVLTPLVWQAAMAFVQYASSGVFQAVALNAVAIAGARQASITRKQAQEQHDAIAAMMRELREMHAELHAKLNS